MVIAGNKQLPRSGSNRRVAVIRPNSPKSPAASASAFESVDGSDEDDATQHGGKLDNGYINTNGNLVSSHLSLVMVFSCYYFYSSTPLSFIFLCQSRSWHEFVCQDHMMVHNCLETMVIMCMLSVDQWPKSFRDNLA